MNMMRRNVCKFVCGILCTTSLNKYIKKTHIKVEIGSISLLKGNTVLFTWRRSDGAKQSFYMADDYGDCSGMGWLAVVEPGDSGCLHEIENVIDDSPPVIFYTSSGDKAPWKSGNKEIQDLMYMHVHIF